MGLLKRFTLKQLLITLQILAFIPWLLGLFIGFYFIYPEIKMDKPLGDKEEEKERVIKELKRIEGEIEAIFKKN
ncbi:MAG: hypothetical protein ABWJ99_03480 [Caldimicrobium sp.]